MKRRSLAALAALALSVTALFGASPAAVAAPDGAPYVALGDSIAAGTGNKPYTDATCLRSKKAYPAVVGAALGVPVVSAACAGATTTDVLQQVAALDAAGALGSDTRLVTITVGANDLGWQQVLIACSNVGTPAACQGATAGLAALADLGPRIAAVQLAVRQAAPQALIAFTAYPLLFGQFTGTCSIGNYDGTPVKVTVQQASAAQDILIAMHLTIQNTVYAIASGGDSNVAFVDVMAGFFGHGLCDTGDRWISGFVRGAPVFERSLHPNAAGQRAYGTILASALDWAFDE
nr:SGNH/GDSL hydrolase family protein [Microbacterium flavescens]